MKPITKDDLDVSTLRIQDSINRVEQRVIDKMEQAMRLLPLEKMQIYDNQDLMFLTRRCTRTLQICRSKKLLNPMYPSGKNFYTLAEVERFRYDILPHLPEELSVLEDFDFDEFIYNYNKNNAGGTL